MGNGETNDDDGNGVDEADLVAEAEDSEGEVEVAMRDTAEGAQQATDSQIEQEKQQVLERFLELARGIEGGNEARRIEELLSMLKESPSF